MRSAAKNPSSIRSGALEMFHAPAVARQSIVIV